MFIWSKLSAAKWEDAWEERFHAAANTNLVITRLPGRKTIRIDVYCHRRENAAVIQKQFGGSIRELKQQNWAALSAASLKPISVRGRLVIAHTEALAESLRRKHPEKTILCIPGELAFGTGDHATTATCLRLLVDFAKERAAAGQPWSAYDLGTGTGILALSAKALGAKSVEACDYDPAAVHIAKRNADLNGIKGIRFFQQDVMKWKVKKPADLVIANIFYDVLTDSFPKIATACKPGAKVIVSGILADQAAACLKSGRNSGFDFPDVIQKGKWVTALGVMHGPSSLK